MSERLKKFSCNEGTHLQDFLNTIIYKVERAVTGFDRIFSKTLERGSSQLKRCLLLSRLKSLVKITGLGFDAQTVH
jgi:hypothetical protein